MQKIFSPITEKLNIVNESTKKLGDVMKESKSDNENTQEKVRSEIDNFQTDLKSLPNSFNLSKSLREMLGSLMTSRIFSKFTQDYFGQAKILGIPIQISGGETIEILNNN